MSRLLGAGVQKASSSLLCVSFNQDASCLSVGTRKGYAICNAEPYGKVYSSKAGPTNIVEMLFCTSLVALVGSSTTSTSSAAGAGEASGTASNPNASPRRLQIVNTKRQSTICELLFPTAILGVKLNRKRLVVVLEEEIYIYDISNMKLLHTIETSPNPQAICALSASSDPCYLVYPSPVPSLPLSSSSSSNLSGAGSSSSSTSNASPSKSTSAASSSGSGSGSGGSSSTAPGDVMVFDLLTLSVVNIIQAHKTPLAALALNSNGTLLATASDKGTLLRVFSLAPSSSSSASSSGSASGASGSGTGTGGSARSSALSAHAQQGRKLWEFRRGSYPARIYSLGFNSMSTLLTCSSDTETVHIFKLVSSQSSSGGGGGANGGSGGNGGGALQAARNAALAAAQGSHTGALSGRAPGTGTAAAGAGTVRGGGASSGIAEPNDSPSLASADGSDSPSDAGHARRDGSSSGPPSGVVPRSGPSSSAGPGGSGGGFGGSLRRRSWALGKNVAGSVGGFLPGSLTQIWEPQRDFAHLKLPTPGVSSLVAISSSTPTVMVVTSEGNFYSYNIDLENGGECALTKRECSRPRRWEL